MNESENSLDCKEVRDEEPLKKIFKTLEEFRKENDRVFVQIEKKISVLEEKILPRRTGRNVEGVPMCTSYKYELRVKRE